MLIFCIWWAEVKLEPKSSWIWCRKKERKNDSEKRVGKAGGPLRDPSLWVLRCSGHFKILFGRIYQMRLILTFTLIWNKPKIPGTFSAQVTMVSFLDSWTFPLFLPVPILSFKSNLVQLFIQFYLQGEPAAVDAPLWDTVENIFFNGQEVPYKGWMLMNYLKQNNQGTLQYELFFICLHAFVALAHQLYGLRKC